MCSLQVTPPDRTSISGQQRGRLGLSHWPRHSRRRSRRRSRTPLSSSDSKSPSISIPVSERATYGYGSWLAALLGHLLSRFEEEVDERCRLVTLVGVIMRGGAASAPVRAAQRVQRERARCANEGGVREKNVS